VLNHGATPRAWDHFATALGLLPDLLPVVSNPDAEISPLSAMKSKGKTPSTYNLDRQVIGMVKWTGIETSRHAVDQWKAEPDYGIAVQTRRLRAIDIDVEEQDRSNAIAALMQREIGEMPIRWRSDSGKQLLVFFMDDGEPWPKRVIQVDGGIVEWLGDGQQFIAFGRHSDGEFYKWGGDKSRRGMPHDIPTIERQAAVDAFDELVRQFGTAEPRIARTRRAGEAPELRIHDDVADWLVEHWEAHDVGSDDQLFIACPFADEHTSDSGPTSTAYFPAGTGGYSQGHFVCLHAHCVGRDDHSFLHATGYVASGFDDLTGTGAEDGGVARPDAGGSASAEAALSATPVALQRTLPEDRKPPTFHRDGQGKILPQARNLVAALAYPPAVKAFLAHDVFNDALMIRASRAEPWRRFTDADMVTLRIELEDRGFLPLGKELLRDCIACVAAEERMDTAVDWLGALRWDGVSRVDSFAHDIWGWDDTPYATAVSRYWWSALAGRVLHPGVRADMAPILIGLQGTRKTTLIQMMVPHEEMYTEVRLDAKEDDISRRLRGKLVAELEELRGLHSRDLEGIKAFITRRRESWVPKFKEFEAFFWRRNLFIGTTNEPETLADPTGERRWLPGRCGVIDVERMVADRDQYWAEGAALFAMEGVIWREAEELAKLEHAKYKIVDRAWTARIRSWLGEKSMGGEAPLDKGYVTIDEVLAALHIMPAQSTRFHEIRAEKALLSLGFERTADPVEGVVFKR
jgi:hypothetical protein